MPPTDGRGRLLPSVSEEESQLAEHLGRVVMMSSLVDAALAAVAAAISGEPLPAFGLSGVQLADQVKGRHPELAERYLDIYRRRNHAVHAVYAEEGAIRLLRPSRSALRSDAAVPSVGDLVDDRPVDFAMLIELWYEMQDLHHDALQQLVEDLFPAASAPEGPAPTRARGT